jgi:hypothetical protein
LIHLTQTETGADGLQSPTGTRSVGRENRFIAISCREQYFGGRLHAVLLGVWFDSIPAARDRNLWINKRFKLRQINPA